eukprot:764781-Hanusia_phi.AAC.3
MGTKTNGQEGRVRVRGGGGAGGGGEGGGGGGGGGGEGGVRGGGGGGGGDGPKISLVKVEIGLRKTSTPLTSTMQSPTSI